MTLKPYASISRIAALATRAGHVVGVETNQTVIETGTVKVTFHADRRITEGDGQDITMEQALKKIAIKLVD